MALYRVSLLGSAQSYWTFANSSAKAIEVVAELIGAVAAKWEAIIDTVTPHNFPPGLVVDDDGRVHPKSWH
jgi:hypothetical protein